MPERSCVACRATAERSELARFVLRHGVVVSDPGGRMPGRGAYLCRRAGCVEQVLKNRGAFARALRARVEPPAAEQLISITKDA